MFSGLTRWLLGCVVASLSVGLAGAGPADAPRSSARAAADGDLATRKGDWAAMRPDFGTDPPQAEALADGLVAFDAARARGWIYATDTYGLWTMPEAAGDGGREGVLAFRLPSALYLPALRR